MRILKSRGDIYFSKTNKKKSTDKNSSYCAYCYCFVSVVFIVGAKNDFSAKKFFEPEDLSTTAAAEESTIALPQVSGKRTIL